MDFKFSAKEEQLRAEIHDFVKRELPLDWDGPLFIDEEVERDEFWAMGRVIARKLGERGWLSLSWPERYGGQARSHIEQVLFKEETAQHRVPGVDMWGTGMLAPTLLAFGSEEQKRRFLPPIARGEVVWCQGFSEPDAGSDLASLRTSAVEKGGDFVINGQKVWTTGAHRAGGCFLLARTDPNMPKHRGISFFLVALETPGITIRPLINPLGGHCSNEVFFDDVTVPQENLVGGKNQGWYVANSLLNYERSGIERVIAAQSILDEVTKYVRETKDDAQLLAEHPLIRQKLGEMAIEVEIGRLLAYRVGWLQDRGIELTYEASVAKNFGSELMQRVSAVGMEILGLCGQLREDSKWAPLRGRVWRMFLSSIGRTIGGGTTEVQKNIIAQRGFGLPRA